MSVTGCSSWCSYPEINDVAFYRDDALRKGGQRSRFSASASQRASTEPHLAVKLNAFVRQGQVLDGRPAALRKIIPRQRSFAGRVATRLA